MSAPRTHPALALARETLTYYARDSIYAHGGKYVRLDGMGRRARAALLALEEAERGGEVRYVVPEWRGGACFLMRSNLDERDEYVTLLVLPFPEEKSPSPAPGHGD